MKSKTLSQGAEAEIILEGDFIIKDRISKKYRHPELDKKIRKRRTKSEAKLLIKASQIINSPTPFFQPDGSYQIKMSFIEGKRLSEKLNNFPLKKQKEICKEMGKSVAKLHKKDIIHGDLTTSNMILNEKLFFIDFGLGYISRKIEDKAVDLHLLKQALEAKHFENWEILLKEIFRAYKEEYPEDAEKIFQRIKAVERRGRYRH